MPPLPFKAFDLGLAAALDFLNHVLTEETWAQDRLKEFSGKSVCFELGTLAIPLRINEHGLFTKAARPTDINAAKVKHDLTDVTDVTISLAQNTSLPATFLSLLSFANDPGALFSSARISGSADFAECLGFVFRNLRWDIENDLAKVFGDIAAHRIARSGKSIIGWHQGQATTVAQSLAEHLNYDSAVLAPAPSIASFCSDVTQLKNTTDRLEQRLSLLRR